MASDKEMKLCSPPGYLGGSCCCKEEKGKKEKRKEGKVACFLVFLQVNWSLPMWEHRLAPAARGGVWLVPRPGELDWAGWGDWR